MKQSSPNQLASAYRDAKKALGTEGNSATENIKTLRRGNGLPEQGWIHARLTDTHEARVFHHHRREPEESIGLPVVIGILTLGFVLGLCAAFLTGWRPW